MKRCLLALAVLDTFAAFAETPVRPGWLGFAFSHHIQGAEQWLVVCAVTPGSPAATAGIQQGSVIAAIDGKPLRDGHTAALLERLAAIRPGDRIRFTTVRNGQKVTRVVTAAAMSDEQYESWKANLDVARRARADR